MTDEVRTTEQENEEAAVVAPEVAVAETPAVAPVSEARQADDRGRGGNRHFSKNPRRAPRARAERVKPEFDQRIIDIRRVTRVVAGGRRFSFSVVVVAGNRKGSVGVGTGKAGDTALAVEKAYRSALKHKIQIPLTKSGSIAHEIEAKYSSGRVFMYPAKGRGVVAGGAVRDIVELAGIKDIGTKILSPSKNKLNIAQAAIKALKSVHPAREKKTN